jgi:hypothetical protein
MAETAQNAESGWAAVAQLLDEALLALGEKERVCVLGKFFNGLTVDELGRQLSISEEAAQKRVSRGLEKLRAFFRRKGVLVTSAVVAGLLHEQMAAAAPSHLTQSLAAGLSRTLRGPEKFAPVERIVRAWFWRKAALWAGSFLLAPAASLLIWTSWTHWAPTGSILNDPGVERLGRDWARTVELGARLKREYPRPPTANDPRLAIYNAEYATLVNDTVRISTALDASLRSAAERKQMALFLAVELRETLQLEATQFEKIERGLNAAMANGPSLQKAMRAVLAAKKVHAQAILQMLTPAQKVLFHQTYGSNGEYLFTYLAAALGTP